MGSIFGDTWEDPGGGFFEFSVKRALKQDQIIHMEGKLQVILFSSTSVGTDLLRKYSTKKVDSKWLWLNNSSFPGR